jgi:hypothetical protein
LSTRDVPPGYHAVLARLDRPRQALINEIEEMLSALHLTSDDLPAISRLLKALLAGLDKSPRA